MNTWTFYIHSASQVTRLKSQSALIRVLKIHPQRKNAERSRHTLGPLPAASSSSCPEPSRVLVQTLHVRAKNSTHVCNDLPGRLSHGRSWEPEVNLMLRGAQSSGHTQRSLQVYDLLGGAWAKRIPCGHPGPISLSICLIYERRGGNWGPPCIPRRTLGTPEPGVHC